MRATLASAVECWLRDHGWPAAVWSEVTEPLPNEVLNPSAASCGCIECLAFRWLAHRKMA